jgi:hypothetical protein
MELILLKDKYQLQFYAKAGGFGEVFIARHIQKDYEVAVKFVRSLHFISRATEATSRLLDSMRMR